MSNYNIFNQEHVTALIQPFANSMAPHIIPIKFEAITPDIFAFLFRTHLGDGSTHYFVSLEFDYIESVEEAVTIIEDWYGAKVIEFLNPESDSEGKEIRVDIDDTYMAVLANVEAPIGDGFWASNIIVHNKTEIDDVVSHLTIENKEDVRKELIKLFSGDNEIEVSVFVRKDGKVEYFFG